MGRQGAGLGGGSGRPQSGRPGSGGRAWAELVADLRAGLVAAWGPGMGAGWQGQGVGMGATWGLDSWAWAIWTHGYLDSWAWAIWTHRESTMGGRPEQPMVEQPTVAVAPGPSWPLGRPGGARRPGSPQFFYIFMENLLDSYT